jgi:hypothetical protein
MNAMSRKILEAKERKLAAMGSPEADAESGTNGHH